MGAEILQVTWNTPAEAGLYFGRHQLAFPYLCDPDLRVHGDYGVYRVVQPLATGLRTAIASATAAAGDLLLHGERPESPLPVFKRYGVVSGDAGQALYLIGRDGVIRDVVAVGAIAAIPSNAEILRRLAALP